MKKHICGEVISRFERKGLSIHAIKMIQVPVELAEEHYAEHKGKGFFKALIDFITSGPVLAMVIEGENAVAAVRQINGATNPLEAVPGSIRGDFATSIDENVVHASDAVETAQRDRSLVPRTVQIIRHRKALREIAASFCCVHGLRGEGG